MTGYRLHSVQGVGGGVLLELFRFRSECLVTLSTHASLVSVECRVTLSTHVQRNFCASLVSVEAEVKYACRKHRIP